MFIILDQTARRIGIKDWKYSLLRGALGAFPVLLSCWLSSPYAQCGFRENGYVFLHPYFNNVNWQAAIYRSVLFPSETMCAEKPSRISWSRLAAHGRIVYTTAAGAWMTSKAPLIDNNCVCCRPTIEFDEPVEISVPARISLQASIPFHLLSRGAADIDTFYLAAAASGNRVYCLHVNARSGGVGAVDTISISLAGQQTIGGVWGEPDSAGRDTALWIGGSSGLLRLIPFKNGQWGGVREFAINNSETVSAIGGGYAGTASGKIFRRSGTSFTLDNSSASSPLRSINARIAVGDNGTLIVNRNNTWRSYGTAGTNYRYGNLTANAGGTAVELIDDKWNYATRTISDSATTISGISPPEVAASLNGAPYRFIIAGYLTVTIRLRDIDDNRGIPSVILKGKGGVTEVNKADDGSTLLRHDPAAVCSTTKAFFNDTLVKLIITYTQVTLEANAKRGVYDASCDFWKWQSFVFSARGKWNPSDTLVAYMGRDTLKIINDSQITVTANTSRKGSQAASLHECSIHGENREIRFILGAASAIRRIILFDAGGRIVWRRAVAPDSHRTIVSPALHSGIHFIRIDFADGRCEIRRIAIPGR